MAGEKSENVEEKGSAKKSSNTLLIVGLGCLGVVVLLAIVGAVVGRVLVKNAGRVGTSLLQETIEKQTGIKTDLSDVEEGKMTFTDTKTGSTVDIGSGKLPDNFPKDFPVYPGSKVASAASGSEKGEQEGFWVTLTTSDSTDKVNMYYKTNLAANGWETSATYQAEDASTQTIRKGTMSGSLTVTRDGDDITTNIVIVLGQEAGE